MWRAVHLAAAGLMLISGLALGLYQSLFFRFASFYGFHPFVVGAIFAAFYVAYFLLALPASLFHRRFGYKLGFLLGLSAFATGTFVLYLAVVQRNFGFFLIAVTLMGSCGALLDTSLNPLAVMAAKRSNAVVRLNIVHLFHGLGLFIGYFVAVVGFDEHFERSLELATPLSARPYLLIGLAGVLLAFFVEQVAFPPFIGKSHASSLRQELGALLGDKGFRGAAAAVFSCGAALMLLWSSHYRYHVNELPGHVIALIERGWIWFVAGRVVWCVLMRWMDPVRLMAVGVWLSVAAIAMAAALGGTMGWISLLSVSALFAIAYPTVLGLALDRQVNHITLAAGLLLAAGGIGCAVFAVSTNLLLDVFFIPPRLIVCLALPLFAVVLHYAHTMITTRRQPPDVAAF